MIKLLAFDVATEHCSAVLNNGSHLWFRSSTEPRSHAQLLLPFIDELVQESGCALDSLDAIALTHGPGSFTGIRIGISVAQGLSYASDLPVILVSSLDALAYGFMTQTHLAPPLTEPKPQFNHELQGGDCIPHACMHNDCMDGDRIITALDARMGEVYWAAYKVCGGELISIQAPSLCSIVDFESEWRDVLGEGVSRVYGIGHGWAIPTIAEQAIQAKVLTYCEQSSCAHCVAAVVRKQWQDIDANLSNEQKLSQLSCPARDVEPLYLRNEITWKKRQRIRSPQ